MTELEGRAQLRAWRKASDLSQADLGERIRLSQPAVAQWETSGRPSLTKALELQTVTDGAVPATSWGYTLEEIERIRVACGDRPAAEPDVDAPDGADPRSSQAA